jgi:hypothetical protein
MTEPPGNCALPQYMIQNYCKCQCVKAPQCQDVQGLVSILCKKKKNKPDIDCARETHVRSTKDRVLQNVEKW